MRDKRHYLILFAIIIVTMINTQAIDVPLPERWINSSYNSTVHNFVNKLTNISSPSVNYEFFFKDRSNNISINNIMIYTQIDPINDVATDMIYLYYDYSMYPMLANEEVIFSSCAHLRRYYQNLETFNNDCIKAEIIGSEAFGWNVTRRDSHILDFQKIEDKAYDNAITIFIMLKNQSNYKRRTLTVYNRASILLSVDMKLNGSYKYTSFQPAFSDFVHNQQSELSLKNTELTARLIARWDAQLVYYIAQINTPTLCNIEQNGGSCYLPDNKIEYSYSYDYDRDTNEIIAREAQYSARLAWFMFYFSTVLAILSYISQIFDVKIGDFIRIFKAIKRQCINRFR